MGRRTESQEELEAPAKVYQFNDLADQLQRVEITVNKMSEKLENQVTAKYLEDRLVAITTSFTGTLNNELKDRDNRMDGFESTVGKNSKSFNRFTWATIGTALTIVGTAIAIIYFTSLKS